MRIKKNYENIQVHHNSPRHHKSIAQYLPHQLNSVAQDTHLRTRK